MVPRRAKRGTSGRAGTAAAVEVDAAVAAGAGLGVAAVEGARMTRLDRASDGN